ncbi:YciI family protein [Oerskovia sp. NPDC057915]|uniref:YciI family protein n=1 Tax=Oerskovia sp. NPDC057915 TaxID=3346280 RepID=UPI0036DE1868
MRYLLGVDFRAGVDESPMEEWTPEEVNAHLGYYGALNAELEASGELVQTVILTGPDLAKVVRSDGTAPVVTDGPFAEFKEWLAGYQIVDVGSEERALEIAGLVSAVPGRGGVPTQQPIQVRRLMDDGPSDATEMAAFLDTAQGTR